jgi:hypothetical protein
MITWLSFPDDGSNLFLSALPAPYHFPNFKLWHWRFGLT